MKRLRIAALSLVALIMAMSLRASVCNAGPSARQAGGLVVDHYLTDVALHRRWAVAMDCSHPDRPWALLDAPWLGGMRSSAPPVHSVEAAKAMPLIPAGAKVRLWSIADGAKISLAGTALEAGATGETIHVRTGQRGTVLAGKVRGAGSVELSASSQWQDKRTDRWNAQ